VCPPVLNYSVEVSHGRTSASSRSTTETLGLVANEARSYRLGVASAGDPWRNHCSGCRGRGGPGCCPSGRASPQGVAKTRLRPGAKGSEPAPARRACSLNYEPVDNFRQGPNSRPVRRIGRCTLLVGLAAITVVFWALLTAYILLWADPGTILSSCSVSQHGVVGSCTPSTQWASGCREPSASLGLPWVGSF
jgi:hypothetical protein